MGRPAASADVHVAGRSALLLRSNTAPDAHVPPLPCCCAPNISYRWQLPESATSTCRSLPASTGALSGTGYGPGSLSLPYAVKVMGTNGWLPGTTTKGMPYEGADPKSGGRNCLNVAMRATYALELGSTAARETSWFHALLAGKTAQPPTVEPPRATTRAGMAGCDAGGAGRGVGRRVASALIGTGVG